MILGAMAQWTTPPGTIVEFRATDTARVAAANAPVDPGPPSFLQADHLSGYKALVANGGRHRGWTGVATDIDGPLDRAAMVRALVRLIRTHGGFRTWFDLSGDAPVRHLVPSDDVAAEAVDGPTIEGDWDTGLQTYMTARFDADCRPDNWPGFSLGVVERPDGFGLFWGCDHAFTDGGSQIMLASELADLYAAEVTEPGGPALLEGALPTPEDSGDFRSFVALERDAASSYTADSPEVVEWVDIVARNGSRLPQFALPLGLAPGEKAPVKIRVVSLLERDEVYAFDRVCKAAGARMTGGVFAAVAQTEYELAGNDRYFGLTVLSTRAMGPYARSQGWFCAFAPVEFEVAGAATFGELTARAHDAQTRAKRLAQAPVHLVISTLLGTGVCTPDSLGSPQMLSYLDLRWFPGVGRPADDRGVHFTGEGNTANASMWINRDADSLYLVAQTPDTPEAVESVARYHERVRDIIRAAAKVDARAELTHAGHVG